MYVTPCNTPDPYNYTVSPFKTGIFLTVFQTELFIIDLMQFSQLFLT